jgi:hypothetical protein
MAGIRKNDGLVAAGHPYLLPASRGARLPMKSLVPCRDCLRSNPREVLARKADKPSMRIANAAPFSTSCPVLGCCASPALSRYDEGVPGFTVEARVQLKSTLLEFATRDPRLGGVAVTGSAATGREDRWSDIDLAFGVSDPALVGAVLSDFSDFMYAQGALHHHDVSAGAWTYRVFSCAADCRWTWPSSSKASFGHSARLSNSSLGMRNRSGPFRARIPGTSSAWRGSTLSTLEAASCATGCGRQSTWLARSAITLSHWPVSAWAFHPHMAAASIVAGIGHTASACINGRES